MGAVKSLVKQKKKVRAKRCRWEEKKEEPYGTKGSPTGVRVAGKNKEKGPKQSR